MAEKQNPIPILKEKLNSNSLSGIYLFTGEETFNKNFYIGKFKDAFSDNPMAEFNVLTFDGKEASANTIISAIESYPVMADDKLIIIKNSGIFKSVSESDKELWSELFDNPPPYAVIIFDEEILDGRSALLKKIKSKGIYAQFDYQDEKTLMGWITLYMQKQDLKINSDAASELISRAGPSMGNIHNEMNKLIDYAGKGATIKKEDVCFVVAKSLQDKIFDMLDFILTGKRDEAFSILADLKVLREEPSKIIALLGNSVTNLLKTKALLKENPENLASSLGVPPFVAKKYSLQSKNITVSALKKMIKLCLNADINIKINGMEKWAVLETLMIELSAVK